jgi:hypothetical protein
MPDIGWRVGCDLNPLDPRDPDDRAWLAACVWADHPQRAARLATALEAATAHEPPQVRRGDARDVLPELLAAVPAHLTACVFHSAVVAHFPEAARAEFAALVPALSRDRPVMWVCAEPDATPGEPRLRLTICRDGAVQQRRPLGNYHPHGEWLEWTDDAADHASGAPSSR